MASRLSREFLSNSLKETRLIRSKIEDLENELNYHHAITKETFLEQNYNPDNSPQENDRMDAVLDDHMRYHERLYTEEDFMKRHVPLHYIMHYRVVFEELEKVIHEIDPYYPLVI